MVQMKETVGYDGNKYSIREFSRKLASDTRVATKEGTL
jgi:hypothetical protein